LILLVLWLPGAWAAESQIVGVAITGNRKIETAAILTKIKSKAGLRYVKRLVSDDIRALFAMGYFEKVEAFEDDVPGGVTIQFVVVEKPAIRTVEFEGFDAIDRDEAKELVQVREFEVLDIHKINVSVEKLISKYEEKGHYLADVRYAIDVDEKKNEAKVTFRVEENDKVSVKKINIIGNKVISSDELMGVMQTQEGGPFSWMTGSGAYREAVFDRDIAAMTFYYGTLGYVKARFGKPEVSVSEDKKWIYITFSVEEGDQYCVGKVDFTGELLYARQDLASDLKLNTGDVFNTEVLRRETLKYTEKYSDLGYAFANVVPQPNLHDDTKTVDITFDVDKGERIYIGRITVTGNTRSKDKVVRRELKINEGELYNGSKKRESRENVLRLGFFDSVEFHQSASKVDPRVVDIEIKVKERSTGQLVIGAGYSAGGYSGFMFQAQLAQNNFLGNGQSASFTANVQTGTASRYDFNLGFTEPYVGYSRWTLGTDLYQTRRDVYSAFAVPIYTENRTGFDLKLGHPVFEFTNFYLTYRLENIYLPPETVLDSILFDRNQINGITSSANASIVYDRRDDRFDPRSGWFWSLSEEYAGLGGHHVFFRTKANLKFFQPLFWDLIFRTNIEGGAISPIDGWTVPINERFMLGGLQSLRGYDLWSIGESRTVSTNPEALSVEARKNGVGGQNIVIGGLNQLLLNAEIEFPIFKEARIRGVIFFDVGNAFDGRLFDRDPTFYADVGYGIRWFTPIGPLRFEFGYPIVKSGAPKFNFTIGPAF
ncbi:MAG: outer membrane protein assembly factor BamA, partial [Deltaproteobacteria bacterium]|nr:outer membrane protein assembly factor BamA [Deltaproteobacteria bacterium]